ncbi:zinc finger protein 197-like isoform X1 [Sceloporus undulatus]|uniref:zinc finger protein 197-like isoform X1 n=1 Tax=Sceloporus undulatus TaxID=8520 RepID=UPI001C4B1017|nr:zinc finger protein 197-like isoform X1 [Sceloporus undulatus]
MKEQNSARPQREGKASNANQSEYMTERPKWELSEQRKDVSGKRMQQRWEAQWQEFLKTLQSPYSACGNLQLSETTPWDDTKAFLASFEQVAEACRWPRGEWVIRLLPALSGEAEQAFQNMESTDQEDYGKVKAAILRADALRVEVQRQHFRQFCCQEVEDPRRIHCQLQELCHQWLKPDRHSKEQILELLILEQFLVSLPPDLQNWIRARGPDSCSQAVALVEDFLMTQQEAVSAKWQKPLQDVCVDSLEVEEVQSDAAEGQVCKEAKQADDAEITLLGNGIKCSDHSSSLLNLKGQEVTEARLSEELLNLKETGVSLHMVEQTLTQPGQQTIFWQVLQEDGGNVQPFGGDGKATPLKVENPQHGGNELEEMPMAMPVMNQEKLPRMAEKKHKERCDKSRYWIKKEKSQQGEIVPEETQKVLAETIPWNFPVTAESHDRRRECKGQQEKRPMEREQDCSEVTESLAGADNKTSAKSTEGGKPLFSKYGRKYCYKSDFVVVHTGENPCECPAWKEDIQAKCCLNKPQEILKRDKLYKYRESFHLRDEHIRHQSCHPEKKPYESCEDEKSFRYEETLQKNQNSHSGRKLHECSVCRKSFTYRAELTRHLRIHTGEKPFECSHCGKCFRQRVHLIGHQRIHTGEKPFKCPECGRGFSRRDKLIGHQKTHRTFIRSLSSVGGKNCGPKGDKKRNPIKMENAQQGEMRPDEIHRTYAETAKGNFVAVEILGQRWEPEGQQRENPVRKETACTELAKGLTGAVSQTSTMHGTEEIPSFLQDEEGYSCRSGYVMHSREDSYECPIGLKHFPEVSCFDKNQGLKVREKENEVSEYIKKENLMGCPSKLSADDDSVSEKEKEGSVQQEGPRRELSEERYTEERCCIRHLMAVHSGAPLFECSHCGKGFTKQKDFISHQMTDHTENNGDMCPDSGTSDREKMSLVKHQTPHMGEFSCKDPNCTDNFEDNRFFVSHCRMNEKEQPHQHLDYQMHFLEGSNPEGYVGTCSECGKCFRNERCFVNPQRTHMQEQSYKQEGEEEPLPANQTNQLNMKCEMCFDCEKLICTNLVLAEPKTEMEQDLYICPDCGKTFQDSRCFANHQRIHGKEQNKKESQQEAYGEEVLPSEERCYQCPTCKRAYSTRYNLRRHQQIHTECKSNKRSSLGKRSSCKWSFSENQNAQGKGEHQYKCSYCGKAFKVKGSLCKHQKIHIKGKPYKCNVCGKAFAYRYTLAYHQESHIKEQMYQHKCSYCRKTFSMQSYLRRHQQLHMGSKPYSCGVCGKAFAYRYALTRHQEIHVEGPSQKCSFCWKAFQTNYSLSRHKRIHTDTRSYQCSICGKVFGRKYSLFRHQDMHEKRSSGNMSSSGKDPNNSLNTVKDEAGTPEKNSNIWPDSSTFAGNQGVQKDGEIPENPEGIGSSRCTKNQNTHLGENPALGLAPERLS